MNTIYNITVIDSKLAIALKVINNHWDFSLYVRDRLKILGFNNVNEEVILRLYDCITKKGFTFGDTIHVPDYIFIDIMDAINEKGSEENELQLLLSKGTF